MDLKKLIKTKQFIEDISNSIKFILWKTFPEISQADKEDIEQEVKLKIWKMVSSGKKIKNLKSYLGRVVYTTTIDIMDKRTKEVSIDELSKIYNRDSVSQLIASVTDSPEFTVEKKELRLTIKKAVNSLMENRRIVLKLHLTGMSLDEMAEFLNWSRNKVRHLLYRGLNDLKEKLEEFGVKS